tara:strand:+ start:566 stop:1018 length:453 start_codon:yes stop_codon:yes gene_type:complete
MLFPFIINSICQLKRNQLWKGIAVLFLLTLGIRVAYSLVEGWTIMEGMMPRNSWSFNLLRFSPLINFLDFLMGAFAARLFMTEHIRPSALSAKVMPWILTAAMLALLIARVYIPINDMLARTLILTPLFLAFLYYLNLGGSSLGRILEMR